MKNNIVYVCFLSLVAAVGGFLFGYDTAVISGTISQVSTQFSLNSMQMGWYVGCALMGSIIGVSFAGVLSDYLGRKHTMIISALLFSISAIGCSFSSNFEELIIYRIIGGAGIGVVSIISPLYISEIAFANYRGRLVSLYQLAITMGFLGAYLVNYQLLSLPQGEIIGKSYLLEKIFITEVWRGMLGMEAFPAILFLILILFIPESPRWLVFKGKEKRASEILFRIYKNDDEVECQINQINSSLRKSSGSEWKILLKPSLLKALLIGGLIALLGQFMGVNAVLYYGPTIFETSGLSGEQSLLYQVIVGLVNMLTTLLALFLIDRVGRKKLVYWGVSGMVIFLLLIAAYFQMGHIYNVPPVFMLIFFLGYIFCSAISICIVVFVLLSEMYPTKVRGIAMSITGFSLWIGTFLVGQLTPFMLDKIKPSGTFLLFALTCLPYIYIMWKYVPETTGKTLEEIESYWNLE